MPYYHAGELIKTLRKQRGISQEKLAEGVMDRANLARLEKGEQTATKEKIDRLLDKLGQPAHRFFAYALSKDEYEAQALRDRLDERIGRHDAEGAEVLLTQMEKHPAFHDGLYRQYLLSGKASLCMMRGEDIRQARAYVNEAIRVSIPEFDEKLVATYMLAYEDIGVINTMANTYHFEEQNNKAILLLERLAKSIRKTYVDEREKALSLSLVLYNLSKYKGLEKDYSGAIEACDEAIERCDTHRIFGMLPEIIYNKAYCLYYLGDKDTCRELIYQAYFCNKVIGRYDLVSMIKENAKKNFDIDIIY